MTMERTCKPVAAETINKLTFKDKMRAYKRSPLSLILLMFVCGAALITMLTLLYLIFYILVKGIPYITPDLFSFTYTSDNVSLMPALISTVVMTIIALVIALPLGIGAAIYSVEYAKRGNKLVQLVRITTETLSGIPSIVYGLFGYLCFVTALHWGYSLLAGAFTVAIMILPLIMRTTEEALISVPDSFREGSFGLGAGRLRTVFHIVLPSAVPGILSGVILAIGRVVGESAALMYTAGSVAQMPGQAGGGLFDSVRTLSVHMYVLSSEGLHIDKTYATAVVLLVIVIGINALSSFVSLRNAAIWDELKDRLKKSALGLSGGQQQRLCIARALAVEPEVLLMDEPTSALDPISTSKIEDLAVELKKDYTIVMVTHNMQQAARISDKTAFFLLGEVIEYGETESLFSMPKDKRTEDYITGRFG